MTAERNIGVAISGGGHRATLWGLGVLLYLVDSKANQRVTTITSVSGGSIANGFVGKTVNFKSNLEPNAFRIQIRPLIDHITDRGLFFYGPATNGFLATVFALATVGLAASGLIVGVLITRVGRYGLYLSNRMDDNPLNTITLWPIGLAIALAFLALLTGTRIYSKQWNTQMAIPGVIGLSTGAVLVIWDIIAAPVELRRLDVLVAALAVTVVSFGSAVFGFGRRSEIAKRGMDSEYFNGSDLCDIDRGADSTLHIICATEMQSGIHAFFSGRFIYSYQFGLSTATSKMKLSEAVQASAALPGAFGPRKVETSGMGFGPGGRAGTAPMMLMDGGVYDNMADQWFVGLRDRSRRWEQQGVENVDSFIPPVDDLIVANASTGWGWKQIGKASQNGVRREIAALSRVSSIFYNTVGRRRRAHLVYWWKSERRIRELEREIDQLGGAEGSRGAGRVRGITVEVNDVPTAVGRANLTERLALIEPNDLEVGGLTGWLALTELSTTYPTVLRRIRNPHASYIIWHAYITTALAADHFLDVAVLPNSLPEFETFMADLYVGAKQE